MTRDTPDTSSATVSAATQFSERDLVGLRRVRWARGISMKPQSRVQLTYFDAVNDVR